MSYRSTLGTAVVALFALSTPIVAADDSTDLAEAAQAKPVQVAKGKGYVICAIPHTASSSPFAKVSNPRPTGSRFPSDKAIRSAGASVLHISLGDGAVKCLLATGQTLYHSPPTGINRIYDFQSRILGIRADHQRLYVLVFVGGAEILDFEGLKRLPRMVQKTPLADRVELPRMVQKTPLDGGKHHTRRSMYYLSVFDTSEGTWLLDVDLKDVEIPTRPPLETLGTGPMKLLDDGVTVYGKPFRFDGKTLVAE